MPDVALGAVAEFAAPRHGVVTRSRAAHFGLTSRSVRRLLQCGLLCEPYPGVLAFNSVPDTWDRRAAVAHAALHGRGVLSHRSAAYVHRLDGLLGDPPIEATVPRGDRLTLPGLIVHQSRPVPRQDRIVVGELEVTGLARTLCDLGSVVGPDRVLQALDDARRRGTSIRWIRHTAERLHRPGQRGTGVLLEWLDVIERDRSVVPGSWFNRLIERCLASPHLPPIEREYVITDADGSFVARVDLAMPDIKLGIEGHSRRHHFGVTAESADEDRDVAAAACGWEILYLGWHALEAPEALCRRVERVARVRSQSVATA